jgi:hypothetical protein
VRVEEKMWVLILAVEMFNCHMSESVCGTGQMEDKRNGGVLDSLKSGVELCSIYGSSIYTLFTL